VVAKKAIKPERAAEVTNNTNAEAVKAAVPVGPGVTRKKTELRLHRSARHLDVIVRIGRYLPILFVPFAT
jgi:hypothetical protein